jgi:hypothetical protein
MVIDESKSSLLLFDIVSTSFIPGQSVGKKVSKLRSNAELMAFYGKCSKLLAAAQHLLKPLF